MPSTNRIKYGLQQECSRRLQDCVGGERVNEKSHEMLAKSPWWILVGTVFTPIAHRQIFPPRSPDISLQRQRPMPLWSSKAITCACASASRTNTVGSDPRRSYSHFTERNSVKHRGLIEQETRVLRKGTSFLNGRFDPHFSQPHGGLFVVGNKDKRTPVNNPLSRSHTELARGWFLVSKHLSRPSTSKTPKYPTKAEFAMHVKGRALIEISLTLINLTAPSTRSPLRRQ
ncbi:hypothetical protein SCHPADRAFT_889025 [Schizopora paradoxa]|uniref:Uncharacterized protein n=1 Tax=Schizopora paradoxa TaxID=27342 RepID=A0A0H2RS78_9AGAM|nr:hypothetical protein SCHPADRAFT_889025 [Schizopora paradoxa]